MQLAGSPLTIVYNGEIYNHMELRKQLHPPAQRFRTTCDTETLLAAYQQMQAACLQQLRGMFALAIYNQENGALFIARDRLGIKPLYYTWFHGGLAFASEIKPLLELSEVSREVNAQRLYDYLRFGITDHGADTLFKDIKQLPSAHYYEVALDNPQVGHPMRYWQVDLKSLNKV